MTLINYLINIQELLEMNILYIDFTLKLVTGRCSSCDQFKHGGLFF